jgi:DNA-directed RNA polymerase subunit RPC12/RpoP
VKQTKVRRSKTLIRRRVGQWRSEGGGGEPEDMSPKDEAALISGYYSDADEGRYPAQQSTKYRCSRCRGDVTYTIHVKHMPGTAGITGSSDVEGRRYNCRVCHIMRGDWQDDFNIHFEKN